MNVFSCRKVKICIDSEQHRSIAKRNEKFHNIHCNMIINRALSLSMNIYNNRVSCKRPASQQRKFEVMRIK